MSVQFKLLFMWIFLLQTVSVIRAAFPNTVELRLPSGQHTQIGC